MRWLGLIAFVACSSSSTSTVIRLDDASDETLATIKDAVAQGHVTADDDHAAHLTGPNGGSFTGAQKPTITWELPAGAGKPHGEETGQFVWLKLSGVATFDVVALASTSYTPDDGVWEKLSGNVTVTIYTATATEGVITGGPYVPTTGASISFTASP